MRSISARMQAAASLLSDSWGRKIDLVNSPVSHCAKHR